MFVCDAIAPERYSLKRLAEAASTSKRKRRVILPAIVPTTTMEKDLYRIIVKPVNAWVAQVEKRILPAYTRALTQMNDGMIRDAADDEIRMALELAAMEAGPVADSSSVLAEVRAWLNRALAWHTRQWVANVATKLGVDVFPFIDIGSTAPQIAAMFEQITGLIKSVSDDTRDRVRRTVWAGVVNKTPRRQIGKQLSQQLGISRRRADFIAIDQSVKVASALTEIRQTEGGIKRYQWKGLIIRERPTHLANNDLFFFWSQPPATGHPGYEPRCRCSALAVLDLFDDEE
jgi:SPP1 gp7 family putative phage head morphogenesis protein